MTSYRLESYENSCSKLTITVVLTVCTFAVSPETVPVLILEYFNFQLEYCCQMNGSFLEYGKSVFRQKYLTVLGPVSQN